MDTDFDTPGSYALLTDGSCVLIRPAEPEDWQAVHDFAAALGSRSVYRRFFGFPKNPGRVMADAVCAPTPAVQPRPRGALLAFLGGAVVGMAEWIRDSDPEQAEIAFVVADLVQGRGVATLLAEHLLDEADQAGIQTFTAITQGENRAMLDVFTTLGLPVHKVWDHGTWLVTVDLDLLAAQRVALLDAAARRERIADDASLRPLLDPDSIAVVGDPQDSATLAVREHLGGFAGRIWHAGADAADLDPDARVQLAVITSPPHLAAGAARVCGAHGARTVIATATGFDDASGRALLDACRATGMRLLGPGSLGVVNTGVRGGLNASLAPGPFTGGPTGVAVQSGGVGLAVLAHLVRLGIGIGTFAAVGDKYDVSANDLLMHWEGDEGVHLGLLHVESFGNPRKFARTARRLSRRMPLLAVDPEQSPNQARTALYAQAGITVVPTLGALVCAAALLAHQPPPRGRRVAVLGNTRGMLSLAVQACVKAGLDVVAARNVTATADAARLRAALTETMNAEPCDALLIALAPTVPVAPHGGLADRSVLEAVTVPVAAVLAEQAETVTVLNAPKRAARRNGKARPARSPVPCYNDAAMAAQALAAAAAATAARDRPEDHEPEVGHTDRAAARSVVEGALATAPRGRALYDSERAALLEAFGIPLAHGAYTAGAGPARRLTVTAWQDPVFGPLLTCLRDGDSGAEATLLVPAGAQELADLASAALPADETGRRVDGARLAEALGRVAALIDAFPQLASVRLNVIAEQDGMARVVTGDVHVAPSRRKDPYLRRLRRAPVE
ncbi:GNAT family N-acetyltransferase [Actinocrinis puniceicyclus]|uniref:GNAT family N-acetyltransferase n=1 Tax=Actinocrinis puniceicyclus TaxID=977794 RepID=A0A8J8BCH3_9ACTN|nr:GNAT family N-acetyltransferase [Actinocrinis puniceicyclus]MBS2964163.1 GNAT family N-acetyltransferase [Actinocrinis puniceicyclus]